MSLVPINTVTLARFARAGQEVAVTSYLEQARDWLSTAVEQTGPEQIAAAKAEIATAAEATKQLNLSKEIQLDAAEMVRRAEYALGKAIRKGQEEGTIRKTGDRGPQSAYERNGVSIAPDEANNSNWCKVSPRDFADPAELHGNEAGIYHMADNVEPEAFDAALSEAKAEGNLSRANVVRKIKAVDSDRPLPLTERIEEIRELAAQGADRIQIAKHFGVREDHIRAICQRHGILTATELLGRRRRIDPNRVLDNVTESLEVAAMSLRDVDPALLDEEDALERLDSLTTSINALRQAVKKIKESFRD